MPFKKKPDKRWRSRADSSLFIATVLWGVDRLRRPLEAAGVDFPVFRELLRIKFVLELRTGPMGLSANAGGTELALVMTVMGFTGLGFMAGVAGILMEGQAMYWVAGSLAFLMVLLGTFLLTHYVYILVDTTDLEVITPRPVSDSTLYAVRLAHLFVYVGMLTVVFTGAAMFLAVFRQPPLAVLFAYPLAATLAAVLVVGMVSLLFTIILRVFGPALYQRIVLWIQILGTASMFSGGQILPKLGLSSMGALSFVRDTGLYHALPPVHLGGLFLLAAGELSTRNVLYALFSVLLPLLALFLTLRLASKHFVAGLAGPLTFGRTPKRGWRPGLVSWLGQRLTRSREELAGFEFTLAMASRETLFLRTALPYVIGFQALGLAMAWNLGGEGDLGKRVAVPVVMSFLLMIFPLVLSLGAMSKDGDARWILCASPHRRHHGVLQGGLKGLFIMSVALPSAVAGIVLLLVVGWAALPAIVLALAMTWVVALVFVPSLGPYLPFTVTVGPRSTSYPTVRPKYLQTFILMFCMVALVGVHQLLCLHPVAVGLGIATCIPILIWRFRRFDRIRMTYALEP